MTSGGYQQPPGSQSRSILFLINSLGVGGSERKAVRLANALAASNSEIALSYLSPPESLLSQLQPAVASFNLHRRGKFSLSALRRLVAILRMRQVRTLVAVNLYSALYAMLARLLCRDPPRVVVSVNTTEFATRKERLQMLVYRPILVCADVLIFGAERQRELWCARYGLEGAADKTMVLYNGVDAADFCRDRVVPAVLSGTVDGGVVLGTVGALRIEKAQVDLVHAVHQLAVHGVDARAIIVGDGPQRAELEREIRRLGVEQRVRLVGEVQDVRPYLAVMDIFVLPSVAVETFSNAVLEAMAMSCPVLVARVGGMDEMLQFGGGMSYPPGDVQSLCKLLMPLIADPGTRQRLGAQARTAVESHFSFDRMVKDFNAHVLDAQQ